MKKVHKWSTEELYSFLNEVVVPIRVVNDCTEGSLGLLADYHIDRITRLKEQTSISIEQLPR